MGIQSPAEVAKSADMLNKQVLKLTEEAKKRMADYKKHSAEFETIRGGLIEGADMINKHVKELTTMFQTFDKMSVKLDAIRKDLVEDGKKIRSILKPMSEVDPDAKELLNDISRLIPINKGNALLTNSKTSIENMTKNLKTLQENMGIAAGDCESLPGNITRPKVA